jgi:enediyne biosynthesis protein E4
MLHRAVAMAAVFIGAIAGACGEPPAPATPSWHQETGYRWRDLVVPRGEPGFTEMPAEKTGIHFQNDVSDSVLLGNRILGQGAGVALGDVDGDGLPDIFLAKTQGCSALYKNLGNWKFEDITKSAGVGACDRNSTGAAFADVDGNGTLDLILLSTRGPNVIFLNDGHGHFTEHKDLGLDTTGNGGTTLAMADVDGDGKLDLYVANYKAYNIDDSIPPQKRAFNQMVRQVGPNKFEVVPEFKNDYKIVMRPDMGGMRMTQRAAPDEFYLNDGHGHFTKVPFTGGRFLDPQGKPISEASESFSLAAKLVDLNGDGAPDLYVGNDFEDLDELWWNDGHGHFKRADWTAQRTISNSSMGVDVADVNGDGLPDLFVTDMLSEDTHRLRTQIPTHTALPKRPGDIETELQQQRNTLFINRGDGTFAEVGQYAGVQASGWSWGTMFLDVDLDGWPDILVANGHLWDIMDADVQEALQNRLLSFPWQRLRWQFPPLPLKNVAFRNRGDMTFEDVSAKWNFGAEADVSHAIAAADLDGDGDLDVVINRLRAPPLILRNNASAPRVAVRLIGDAPNTQAVGAKVRLLGGAVPRQEREVVVGGLYMSHSDYEVSLAMGKSDSAMLEIDWRDGRRTTLHGVKPNRLYEISQATAAQPDGSTAVQPADGSPPSTRPPVHPSTDPPLFEDATSQLGGHKHVDPWFDDWERQFLIPNSLAQLGPGVAWFDYDRDGYEDLLVGAGSGGRLGVFHNEHGHLVPKPSQGPVAPADFTTVLGTAGDGGSSVLLGVSSWEGGRDIPSAIGVAAGAQGVAAGATTIVPSLASATGPLAVADYDGDGTLDLFVGGRAIPGRYPVPASSALYRNIHGTYVLDTANTQTLKDVGMVSAAMFADLDGDGHPDLVLAREWGSILVLLNKNGRFVPAPESWGFNRWTSRWNGIAAGDLDGDGRLDLVATSWGRNVPAKADTADPLVMVYGVFAPGAAEEMILAKRDPRVKGLAPLNSYARVRTVMPDLATRISTFGLYADATLDQVLGPHADQVQRRSAVTLDNMVFLNRGDHFEAHALPVDAQLAPASYAGIADFDGDGNEDVFLTQNFFPTAVGLPRYDNGRGLLLLGDGKGGLTPMSGAKSGIEVYGDQRGAAYGDYDHDGRLDLVVSQNGSTTRLFHNRGAKPGLRVRVVGPASNPDAIGAQVRVVYGDKMGPVREIQSGSGYWSQNAATQVFGLSGTPTAIWVRWPGGGETRTPVPSGAKEVVVRR